MSGRWLASAGSARDEAWRTVKEILFGVSEVPSLLSWRVIVLPAVGRRVVLVDRSMTWGGEQGG
jgi:hypothetical protein